MTVKIKTQTKAQALQAGEWIEKEHKSTYDWLKEQVENNSFPSEKEFYKRIAEDHLKENDQYYVFLIAMENAMKFFEKNDTGEYTFQK